MDSTPVVPGETPTASVIVRCINDFVQELGQFLDKMNKNLSTASTVEEFFQREFEVEDRLHAIIARGEFLKALSVTSMEELKTLVERYKDSEDVQKAYKGLQEMDRKWDLFADELELEVAKVRPPYAQEFLDVGGQLTEEQKQLVFTEYPSKDEVVLNNLICGTPYTLFSLYRAMG